MNFAPKTILTWLVCFLLASQGAVRALHHHDDRSHSEGQAAAHAHDCPYCSHAADDSKEVEAGAEEEGEGSSDESSHDCLLCQTLAMPANLVAELTLPECECAFETIYSTECRAAAPALNITWARGPPASC